jgi:DNA-binding CsgD family transcriptional regulator
MMFPVDKAKRLQRRVAEACREAETPTALLVGVSRALQGDLAMDRWCGITIDPALGIATGGFHDEGVSPHRVPRLLEIEFLPGEANTFSELLGARASTASLSEATGGDLHRSARWRDVLQPDGLGDEMRMVFRDGAGRSWGGFTLFRGEDAPWFTSAEVALVARATVDVASALRRVLLLAEVVEHEAHAGPVLLILDGQLASVLHASQAAQRLLAEIEDGSTDRLPYALHALALRASLSRKVARTQLRTRTGRWITAHAEPLEANMSIILEPTRPHELAKVLSAAHGLTRREIDVVRLVAAGCTNVEIARLLVVSRYTVQDHVKRVFEKLDVATRSELVSKLFFDHYLPRMESGSTLGADGWFASPPEQTHSEVELVGP